MGFPLQDPKKDECELMRMLSNEENSDVDSLNSHKHHGAIEKVR